MTALFAAYLMTQGYSEPYAYYTAILCIDVRGMSREQLAVEFGF